jgi:hypothetical protein
MSHPKILELLTKIHAPTLTKLFLLIASDDDSIAAPLIAFLTECKSLGRLDFFFFLNFLSSFSFFQDSSYSLLVSLALWSEQASSLTKELFTLLSTPHLLPSLRSLELQSDGVVDEFELDNRLLTNLNLSNLKECGA